MYFAHVFFFFFGSIYEVLFNDHPAKSSWNYHDSEVNKHDLKCIGKSYHVKCCSLFSYF